MIIECACDQTCANRSPLIAALKWMHLIFNSGAVVFCCGDLPSSTQKMGGPTFTSTWYITDILLHLHDIEYNACIICNVDIYLYIYVNMIWYVCVNVGILHNKVHDLQLTTNYVSWQILRKTGPAFTPATNPPAFSNLVGSTEPPRSPCQGKMGLKKILQKIPLKILCRTTLIQYLLLYFFSKCRRRSLSTKCQPVGTNSR